MKITSKFASIILCFIILCSTTPIATHANNSDVIVHITSTGTKYQYLPNEALLDFIQRSSL